jgi:hypothetical protein
MPTHVFAFFAPHVLQQKKFFADNIPEINHSHLVSPWAVQSASCAVDFFCYDAMQSQRKTFQSISREMHSLWPLRLRIFTFS